MIKKPEYYVVRHEGELMWLDSAHNTVEDAEHAAEQSTLHNGKDHSILRMVKSYERVSEVVEVE